jgi:hypothetical protein
MCVRSKVLREFGSEEECYQTSALLSGCRDGGDTMGFEDCFDRFLFCVVVLLWFLCDPGRCIGFSNK